MVSTKCTMTAATVSRVRRYAFADSRRNQLVSHSRNGKLPSATRPSSTSSTSSSTAVPTSVSAALTSPSKPVSSISSMASTSEVSRLITRPEVYRSWKAGLSRWKWANSRRRSSSRTF